MKSQRGTDEKVVVSLKKEMAHFEL